MPPIKLDPPLVLTPGPDNPVRLVISRNGIAALISKPVLDNTDALAIADAIIREGAKGHAEAGPVIDDGDVRSLHAALKELLSFGYGLPPDVLQRMKDLIVTTEHKMAEPMPHQTDDARPRITARPFTEERAEAHNRGRLYVTSADLAAAAAKPEEITPEMIEAGVAELESAFAKTSGPDAVARVYRAMRAAAR